MSKLANRDYYLIIDKSGSMEAKDTPTGQTRFKYVEESVIALSRKLVEYDPDGATLLPFAGGFKAYENITPEKVADVFKENEPMGGTVLAPVLKHCFEAHAAKKKAGTLPANGSMIVVITDGQPSDENEVAKTISAFTQTLENGDDEMGIAMIQVGKDGGATAFLKKLDDDLTTTHKAKFDIVDTKTIEDVESIGLVQALTAALDD